MVVITRIWPSVRNLLEIDFLGVSKAYDAQGICVWSPSQFFFSNSLLL
jgi:hypothetical protein